MFVRLTNVSVDRALEILQRSNVNQRGLDQPQALIC